RARRPVLPPARLPENRHRPRLLRQAADRVREATPRRRCVRRPRADIRHHSAVATGLDCGDRGPARRRCGAVCFELAASRRVQCRALVKRIPIIGAAAAAALVMAFGWRYGIFRDELYYLACARRLAW